MNFVMLIFALIGTTLIVSRSTLFRPVRRLWPLFMNCSQCVGFWIGASAGAGGLVSLGYDHVADAFLMGTATSFLAMFSDAVLVHLLGDPDEKVVR